MKVISLSVNSHCSKSWAGGKLGYVAPHMKLDEFQKMCFCKLPGSTHAGNV